VKRLALLAGLLTLLGASSAEATITLGQLPPSGATFATCGPTSGSYIQPTVTSGNSYVVPRAGRITSWTTAATSNSNQTMSLKIFRPLGGAAYLAVSHDGPHSLTPSAVNTFAVNLAVQPGDVLGVNTDGTPNLVGCRFDVPGDTSWGSFPASPDDGQSATFMSVPDSRLNLTAEFDPPNAFTITGTTRHKKKGTATLTVDLPGPGAVSLGGRGLKSQETASAGGALALNVIAAGKVRRKLRKRGKAPVAFSVTFAPTGGTPSAQPQSLKLVKKG
jgi:hypothetical protein